MFSQKMLKTLDRLKLKLMFSKNLGFISCLLATLDIKDLNDIPELKEQENFNNTACVDGSEMLINEEWFLSLDDKTQEIVLLHEAMHIAKLHPLRMTAFKDLNIGNMAVDYVVNRDLVNLGYSASLFEGRYCYDPQYDQYSEEEIYLLLTKNNQQQQQNNNPNQPCNGGIGNADSDPDSNLLPNNNAPLSYDVIPIDSKNNPTESFKLINKVAQTIELAKSRGWEIGNGIEETISDFLHPKLKWNQILRKYFNELVPGHIRTWARPNRRYPDTYRPSKDKERSSIKQIFVFIDTSCSVSDEELKEYLSEVKFLHKQIKPKELQIIDFDININKVSTYKAKDKFIDFKFIGRGGTSYEDVMEYIRKYNPEFAIIFTDLECNIPKRPNKTTNIFWIRTGNSKYASKPEYGVVIPYEEV